MTSFPVVGHPDWQPFAGVPQELAVNKTVSLQANEAVFFFIGDVSTHGVLHGIFTAMGAGEGVSLLLDWLSRGQGAVLAEYVVGFPPFTFVEFSLPVLSPRFQVQVVAGNDPVDVRGTLFASSAASPFASPTSFKPLISTTNEAIAAGASVVRRIGRGKRGFLYVLATANVGAAVVTHIKERGSDLIDRTFYLIKHPVESNNVMRLPWRGAPMVFETRNVDVNPHAYDLYVWIGE